MSSLSNKLGNIVKDENVIKRLKGDIDDLTEPQINALLDVIFIRPRGIRQMRELRGLVGWTNRRMQTACFRIIDILETNYSDIYQDICKSSPIVLSLGAPFPRCQEKLKEAVNSAYLNITESGGEHALEREASHYFYEQNTKGAGTSRPSARSGT
jgi:hypothetical protein